MVKVYGYSDDLVEIDGAPYPYDEVGCYDRDVRIWFDDGTVIRVGYGKQELAVWYIEVEEKGTAKSELQICEDEEAEIYSDIFEIEADFLKCEAIGE